MAVTYIESHLFPNDVLKTSRINKASRKYLVEKIGEKPSVMQNDDSPVGVPVDRMRPFMIECAAVLTRLWDAPAETQDKVRKAFQDSIEFEELVERRKAQFGHIDWDNIGVGNGHQQTKELARFDVVLDERVAPIEGHDWAEGFGKAPDSVAKPIDELRVSCPDKTCGYFEPWGRRAAQRMGQHVHHEHPELKKVWKSHLKEFKVRNGIAT